MSDEPSPDTALARFVAELSIFRAAHERWPTATSPDADEARLARMRDRWVARAYGDIPPPLVDAEETYLNRNAPGWDEP